MYTCSIWSCSIAEFPNSESLANLQDNVCTRQVGQIISPFTPQVSTLLSGMLKKHLLSIQKNPGMEKFRWLGGFFTNTQVGWNLMALVILIHHGKLDEIFGEWISGSTFSDVSQIPSYKQMRAGQFKKRNEQTIHWEFVAPWNLGRTTSARWCCCSRDPFTKVLPPTSKGEAVTCTCGRSSWQSGRCLFNIFPSESESKTWRSWSKSIILIQYALKKRTDYVKIPW